MNKDQNNHNLNLNKIVRESLEYALILLMNQKDFNDITITELCKKAGVSRMAFYNNYESKEDILKTSILKSANKLVDQVGSPFRQKTDVSWYIHMFEIIKEDEYYLKTIFNAGFNYEYLKIITDLVLHDKTISSTKTYMRLIWAGGIVNAIFHWLETDMEVSIEEISKFCFDNLSVWTN